MAKSPATARPPIPQKFADALQMQVKLSFENQPITEIIKTFSGRIADSFDESNRMVFVVDTESLEAEMGLLEDVPLTFHNGTMDLQHALQVIADTTPFRFVFRDYGILVTTMSRIALIRAATIPADMPLARDR